MAMSATKKRAVARQPVRRASSADERLTMREDARRMAKPVFTGKPGTIVRTGRTDYRIEGTVEKMVPYRNRETGEDAWGKRTYAVVRNVTSGHDGRGTELKAIG